MDESLNPNDNLILEQIGALFRIFENVAFSEL